MIGGDKEGFFEDIIKTSYVAYPVFSELDVSSVEELDDDDVVSGVDADSLLEEG